MIAMCCKLLLLLLACPSAIVCDYDNKTPQGDSNTPYAEGDSVDEDIIPTNSTNDSATTADPFTPIFIVVDMLPSCDDGEFLTSTSNGSDLFCMPIPERQCRCPGPDSMVTGEPSTMGPKSPLGCPSLTPHEAGAFVCVTAADEAQIYCSALCDSTSEFSSLPLNPYACGIFTNFMWVDFFNITYSQLPQCDGFRYSLRPIYLDDNYLPRPCKDLSEAEVDKVKVNFCDMTRYSFFIQCNTEDVSILCGK